MTKKQLIKVAKQEMQEWVNLPPGLVLAILFAFVHRVTEGETVEETFFKQPEPSQDWQI